MVVSAFLEEKIARLHHHTASHPSQAHYFYETLCALIPPEDRKDVFCMHLDGDYADKLRDLGFSVVERKCFSYNHNQSRRFFQ